MILEDKLEIVSYFPGLFFDLFVGSAGAAVFVEAGAAVFVEAGAA